MNIFLLCNAHLDPVWQWNWDEGVSEAISTFRCAADFCEEYDGFVFNHNEALLYRYVEEYDAELFDRISRLIARGKWVVIGGWYLQPDCNIPCGESIIGQIKEGLSYFKEKFNIRPSVAMNIDSFGHSKGLVQILQKSGYKGYLFMRPMAGEIDLPSNDFLWQGYSNSNIIGMRYPTWYNTPFGCSVDRIKELTQVTDNENVLVLWGMGDHGGGPSRKDIEDIEIFSAEALKKGIKVFHSDIESYLNTIKVDKISEFDKPLHHSMPGCYSSMSRIKTAHRNLENQMFFTKSICSIATMNGLMHYPKEEIHNASLDLYFAEFHDLLPGTGIKDVEKTGLEVLSHGNCILSQLRTKAFLSLCKNQIPSKDGMLPIFVYNPHPFEYYTEISCEFMLQNQNHDCKNVYVTTVFDDKGNLLPSQMEKERSNINLDWRKKVVFYAKLSPMSINKFDCKLDLLPIEYRDFDWRGQYNQLPLEGLSDKKVYSNNNKQITIDKNGLITSWIIDNKEMINKDFLKFIIYEDTCDPWGMEKFDFSKKKFDCFELANPVTASKICGFNHETNPVRIIEDGKVRTVIQSIWVYKKSYIVLNVTIPKHLEYVDMNMNILMLEKDSMLKSVFSPNFSNKYNFKLDDMFGNREIDEYEKELPMQKWSTAFDDKYYMSVYNIGQSSVDFVDNKMRITLLRTPAYCAHPTDGGVPAIPQTSYSPRIDIGEHDVSLRIDFGKSEKMKDNNSNAVKYNIKPYAMSYFPNKDNCGKILKSVRISDSVIQMTNFEYNNNNYIIRFFNSDSRQRVFTVYFPNFSQEIVINALSVDTYSWDNKKLLKTNILGE